MKQLETEFENGRLTKAIYLTGFAVSRSGFVYEDRSAAYPSSSVNRVFSTALPVDAPNARQSLP